MTLIAPKKFIFLILFIATLASISHARAIRILSIDGGGIRGLIPAILLVEIEKKTGKKISELFDILAGSSTGGLIALGLTTPNKQNNGPLLSAEDIMRVYETKGSDIFRMRKDCDFWIAKRQQCLQIGPLYESSSFETVVKSLVGDHKFKDAIKPLLITSFDIEARRGYSLESNAQKFDNLSMLDVARATSAAPTYFNPMGIMLKKDDATLSQRYMIDGGLYKNSPAILAYRKAQSEFGDELEKRGFILVSLGTGKPIKPHSLEILEDESTDAVIEVVNIAMEVSINEDIPTLRDIVRANKKASFFEIQTALDNNLNKKIGEMDNVNKNNLENLRNAAEKTKNSAEFRKLIDILKQ